MKPKEGIVVSSPEGGDEMDCRLESRISGVGIGYQVYPVSQLNRTWQPLLTISSVAAERGDSVLDPEVAGKVGWWTLVKEGLAIGDPNLNGGNKWSGVPYHIGPDHQVIKPTLTYRFIPKSRSGCISRSRRRRRRRNLRRWSRRSDRRENRWIRWR